MPEQSFVPEGAYSQSKDTELSKRKQEIKNALPAKQELAEMLFAHISAKYIEDRKHSTNSAMEEGFIAGELAELLVEKEFTLFPINIEGVDEYFEKSENDRRSEDRLLGYLNHPAPRDPGRNPDLAWLDMKNMTVKIIGEVKTSRQLDVRCYKQMLPSGTEANLHNSIDIINGDTELRHDIFGINPDTNQPYIGRVDSNLRKVLFLPQDTDISDENLRKLFLRFDPSYEKGKKGMVDQQINKFIEMINQNKIILKKYSFDRKEISDMVKDIYPLVVEISKRKQQEAEQEFPNN